MLQCVYVRSHVVVSDSATPWTAARQAPLSLGFPRPEYWSGLPRPSPGDLPYPGIKPTSPSVPELKANSLPLSHQEAHLTTKPWKGCIPDSLINLIFIKIRIKWYKQTYVQSRNKATNIQNKLMLTEGEKGRGINWEIGTKIYKK